ncbi:MAG TPA: acyltransferase [Burkholderiales bacterium]|nr:acyltransferase [Burkholderiales bacterium]
MERNKSVDTIRLFAITAVIIIHAESFSTLGANSAVSNGLFIFLNQIGRFAVPFFFVLSGYYWGRKIRNGVPIFQVSARTLRKLALVFVVWSIIYLLPDRFESFSELNPASLFKSVYWRIMEVVSDPVTLLFQGTKVHLWFLIGLACAIVITSILLATQLNALLPFISVALYVLGLAAKSYVSTPLGLDMLGTFNTRNGPFFSTIFFVTGYYLSSHTPTPQWLKYGLMIFLCGLAIHFSEIFFLWETFHIHPANHDYVFGTYFLGLGAAMAALSNHLSIRSDRLGAIGSHTLGIYVMHFLFLDLLAPFVSPHSNPLMEILYVFAILTLSIASSYLLARTKFMRSVVT